MHLYAFAARRTRQVQATVTRFVRGHPGAGQTISPPGAPRR